MRPQPTSAEHLLALARQVLDIEADALRTTSSRLDAGFADAVHLILACSGRVVVSGMGKSGHIGGKIAATLASTGTPAFFMHPGEASHGDLGMIAHNDVVLALSNSGESSEIVSIVPLIKRRGAKLIAMTGNPHSTLAREADATSMRPSTRKPARSTCAHRQHHRGAGTGRCAGGALLDAAAFRPTTSPLPSGGSLGRRLLVHVRDVMHSGDELPKSIATLRSSRPARNDEEGLGMTAVVDAAGKVAACSRRRPAAGAGACARSAAGAGDRLMTPIRRRSARRTRRGAVEKMETLKINGLLVVDPTTPWSARSTCTTC